MNPVLHLTPELFKKYDVAGPRYTSYPTAPEWSAAIGAADYEAKLAECAASPDPLSVYIHIPFCESLCYYCGCNIAIRKRDPATADEYLKHVFMEMDKVVGILGRRKRVRQFHLGGGTPTFLTNPQLEALYKKSQSCFDIDPQGEIAIEIEPRRAEREQLVLLKQLGFNRVSMGIQDFDEKVQQSVNRVHSFEHVAGVFERLRDIGFAAINIDLIYGLPHQTLASFNDTVQKIDRLRPSRIALYSYAHIPSLMKQQKRLDVDALPPAEEKINIFIMANQFFKSRGYADIAMDHFALEDDEMAQAYRANRLNRNFMGYTVLPAEHFLGFGVSAIGCLHGGYFQNVKHLPEYYARISRGDFALERGLVLSRDDLIRKKLINSLMCRLRLSPAELSAEFGLDFASYFALEHQHIQNCLDDGLLAPAAGGDYLVTELGRLFVRNIAMGFDAYLRKEGSHKRFSRTI